jgi:hypothetical protein
MAGMYECQFLKVDVDENEETTIACNITNMPTFQFYKVPPSLTHTHSLARSLARSLALLRTVSYSIARTLLLARARTRALALSRPPPPPPISLSLHLSLSLPPSLSSPHAPGILTLNLKTLLPKPYGLNLLSTPSIHCHASC